MASRRRRQKAARRKKQQATVVARNVSVQSIIPQVRSSVSLLRLPSTIKSTVYNYFSAKPVTEQPTGQPSSSPFPFLRLPSELRNRIYKYTLTSNSTLRRIESIKADRAGRMVAINVQSSSNPLMHRNEVRLRVWSARTLLFTCRTIYNEGLSILYSCNKLHFPAIAKGLMRNKRQQTSFSLLQHVSFDYSHTPLAAWDEYRKNVYWTGEVAKHVDTTISTAVKQVSKGCPVLKTLTIHVLSFPAFVHLIGLAAHNDCTTAVALSKMALKRLTIVGIPANLRSAAHPALYPRGAADDPIAAMECSEYAFLASIAPWSRWHRGVSAKAESHWTEAWPGLNANPQFIDRDSQASMRELFPLYEYQNDRRGHYMEPLTAQMWHLRPALVLPAAI